MLRFVLLIGLVAGVVATMPIASAEDMNGWRQSVISKYKEKFRYPRSAIQRGIEGSARVRLFIAQDGTIVKHEVLEETGEKVLDRELPKLINRLNPLPAPPSDQGEMTMVLPVVWRLS